MNLDDLVQAVCISLNDFMEDVKTRIRLIAPASIKHILTKYQWDFLTLYDTFLTSVNSDTNRDWVLAPEELGKEIAMYRADLLEPITFISVNEYVEKLSGSSNPYGYEACHYTIGGDKDDPKIKRIYFLDIPTSDLTIKLFYTQKIENFQINKIPNEFIETIKSHIVYRLTAPMVKIGGISQPNPTFTTARDDYRINLAELISYENAQRGRKFRMRLGKQMTSVNKYLHK